MLSFIVIGRNEGWKLSLCLGSIIDAVERNRIMDFEIIYVDSQSTDDSIKIIQEFSGIKIFKIEGKCSAAIARNIGAKEAKGDILVFLDGDMKLDADFLSLAMKDNGNLIYPFQTGIYQYCYYDRNNIVIKEKSFDTISDNTFVKSVGGFFIISKKLWQRVGGMDNRLVRNEDIDLGLRLCKINTPALKQSVKCINHYSGIDGFSAHLLKYAFYYRYSSVLARKHLFNIHYLPMLLRMNYTSILFFAVVILSFINVYFFLLYIMLILVRALVNKAHRSANMILYYLLRDITFVVSFFIYYPISPRISYRECSF